MKKQFIVIGLGRFGRSVATALASAGNDVLGVDTSEALVEDMAPFVTHAVQADATDEKVLKALGITNFDVAVVAIGGDIQASIMVTMLLKEQGVPKVLVKAQSDIHAKVLERIGADRIVFPERDMGNKVALNLASENIIDFIEVSPDYSLMEVDTVKAWVGKTLIGLNFRQLYNVNIIAIKKESGKINVNPAAADSIENGDSLMVVGSNEDIKKLVEYITKHR